jgi:hypothetical protein
VNKPQENSSTCKAIKPSCRNSRTPNSNQANLVQQNSIILQYSNTMVQYQQQRPRQSSHQNNAQTAVYKNES